MQTSRLPLSSVCSVKRGRSGCARSPLIRRHVTLEIRLVPSAHEPELLVSLKTLPIIYSLTRLFDNVSPSVCTFWKYRGVCDGVRRFKELLLPGATACFCLACPARLSWEVQGCFRWTVSFQSPTPGRGCSPPRTWPRGWGSGTRWAPLRTAGLHCAGALISRSQPEHRTPASSPRSGPSSAPRVCLPPAVPVASPPPRSLRSL